MRSRTVFLTVLAIQLGLFAAYGIHRTSLGVDFTDEGAYLAWPMRLALGETPFTSELMTLIRPFEVYLAPLFQLHPGITLYEFRLLGWTLHLAACGVFAGWLFRLGAGPLLAPLVAASPFFICHIFGLAPPSYNGVSGDSFLIALALLGHCRLDGENSSRATGVGAGLALFLATFAHPGLGAVAALLLGWELWRHGLVGNTRHRRPTATNLALLVFLGGWVAFAAYFAASGAMATWLGRLALSRSFAATSLNDPATFFTQLAAFPFKYTPQAVGFTALAVLVLAFTVMAARHRDGRFREAAGGACVVGCAALPLATWWTHPAYLNPALAQSTLLLGAGWLAGRWATADQNEREVAGLALVAVLASLVYGTLTYNFGPHRSWTSGSLALPFAFGTLLTLQLPRLPAQRSIPTLATRAVVALLLGAGTAGSAWNHYQSVYRDGPPEELTTPYRLAKFRGIVSTAERVAAVEALHAYLAPKLTRGEPFLAFDNCPMLYYLFDVRPAYGLAWATRYSLSPAALDQLNREFQAGPLPRYAIRNLVSLASTVWATAPTIDYSNYRLNETLLAQYEPDRTIFPFEIWRRREPSTAPKP